MYSDVPSISMSCYWVTKSSILKQLSGISVDMRKSVLFNSI